MTKEEKTALKALAAKLAADLRAANDRLDASAASHSVEGFRVRRPSGAGRYSFVALDPRGSK